MTPGQKAPKDIMVRMTTVVWGQVDKCAEELEDDRYWANTPQSQGARNTTREIVAKVRQWKAMTQGQYDSILRVLHTGDYWRSMGWIEGEPVRPVRKPETVRVGTPTVPADDSPEATLEVPWWQLGIYTPPPATASPMVRLAHHLLYLDSCGIQINPPLHATAVGKGVGLATGAAVTHWTTTALWPSAVTPKGFRQPQWSLVDVVNWATTLEGTAAIRASLAVSRRMTAEVEESEEALEAQLATVQAKLAKKRSA